MTYIMLKKNFYTAIGHWKKISNSRGLGKKFSPKLKHPYSPPPQKLNGQPRRGWGKNGFDTLVNVIHQKKWLVHVHHVVVFKTKVLHFKIENMLIKDRWKEKVQKSTQFPFCGQTKDSRYEIVFRGIQPSFLHGGSENWLVLNQLRQ